MTATEEQFAFVAALAEEVRRHDGAAQPPHKVAKLAHALIRHATAYNRLNVWLCNERETDDWAAKTKKIVDKVAELLRPYGIAATFQGDPRGPAIKLALRRSGASNDFGGERLYCVPERGAR
jgi:hypothetical protein